MELLRTLLFVPGNKPDMIQKACSLPADALVLDMEDSVPEAEKVRARTVVKDSLPGLVLRGRKLIVRVNSLATGLTAGDLEAVIGEVIDAINLPKANSAADIEVVDRLIAALEERKGLLPGRIKLTAWVETALGVVNAYEIARASPRMIAISFGADDYAFDMGIERSPEETELLYPKMMVAVAARAANILALDTPYVHFRDNDGLIREAKLARQMGFQGKFLIHPDQIATVNDVFRPSAEEIARARRVLQALDQAKKQGSAVTSLDGRMIDAPVEEKARKTIALADLFASRDREIASKQE